MGDYIPSRGWRIRAFTTKYFDNPTTRIRLRVMSMPRERFEREELETSLRYYDLGKIRKITPFSGGSRRAPKVIIETDRGKFLFKRRAKGKDDVAKVAFTHQIQLTLAEQNFPLPHLIRTRQSDDSMLVLGGKIYEMFEFVEGTGYDASGEATYHSGRTLGLYHKLLEGFKSDYRPSRGSYHNAETIHQAIRTTVSSLPLTGRPPPDVVTGTVRSLEDTYRKCTEQVRGLGCDEWPEQIVHGDWHPGNMLFREEHVVAVIDYDSARIHQRVIDLANGALQFSILGGGDDPGKWPVHVDEDRFEQFMRGYDSVNVVARREIEAIPHLMCEAMIAEAALPIAATGSFGGMQGFPFLRMIQSKVNWIESHRQELCAALGD